MKGKHYLVSAETAREARWIAVEHGLKDGEWTFIPEFPLPVRQERMAGCLVDSQDQLLGSFFPMEISALVRR